jgi:hypothetical protein
MADEDWTLGPSLDALNDLLHGGIGALAGVRRPRIVWRDHAISRAALGVEITAAYYRNKLSRQQQFDQTRFERRLAELLDGTGPTYFDTVLEVFADHPEIELVLD